MMIEALKIIGGVLGVLAFAWKVWDLFQSYLHIGLTVEINGDFLFARTTIENKSLMPKRIDNALLLVGPESESPLETYLKILEFTAKTSSVKYTNEIVRWRFEEVITGLQGRAIMPLDFYYFENIKIADETLSYCAPISCGEIPKEIPYSVRFFISGEQRLHRSTHDCFLLHAVA